MFDLITKINSNINYGMKFIHDPPVCSSKINLELKYSTMKKVITGMGFMQFILMILLLFFIVTLSACNGYTTCVTFCALVNVAGIGTSTGGQCTISMLAACAYIALAY